MHPGRARALYIPHGGGPLPLLGDTGHAELAEGLRGLERDLGRPHGSNRCPTGPGPSRNP